MNNKKIQIMVAFLTLMLVFASVGAMAQTSRGSITGVVTDPSGAAVKGATVKIINNETNVERDTVTNSVGIYLFEAVNLGTYSVKVSSSGFGDSQTTGIGVQAARPSEVNIALKVGAAENTVTVDASATEVLQTTEPLRGGSLQARSLSNLPISGLDSISLTTLIPGVVGASTASFGNGTNISVNGQRSRGNNFMIDGVENNDISVGGTAFTITNPDSLQEVSVQTSNFSAEFGRAGGAVVNQITKSGTNQFHGSAVEIYDSHVFDSASNFEKTGGSGKAKFVENTPSFTIGGPIFKDKTFFFGAGQWDRFFSSAQSSLKRVPTALGVTELQALSATCPNAALYLQALGALRGQSSVSNINIAVPAALAASTCTGTARTGQTIETGLVARTASQINTDFNYLIRVDHNLSNRQQLSGRWIYDKASQAPGFNNLDGFDNSFAGRTLGIALNHTYVISPTWTNELRFNYGRIEFGFPDAAPDAFHKNLLNYAITGVTGFGLATNIPQGRNANNWQYQETMSLVKGKHDFRFGADFLRQLASQIPPFVRRGALAYNSDQPSTSCPTCPTVTGLANFLDDFGGNSGSASRSFGNPVYRPNLFRQSYFFQDTWKATNDLTLTLGMRYENFGQPANTFQTPAFTNYDAVNFAAPNKVKQDNNNFGPTLGFAWSPTNISGWTGKLLGDGKSVIRGGYQVSYDSFFNNLLSNIAGSSPNVLQGLIQTVQSAANPRGQSAITPAFGTLTAIAPTAQSPQNSLFDPNIRNPYTQRMSFGYQRELPQNMLVDVSYVGALSRKLFETLDMNPFVSPGVRFNPNVGQRTERCSCAAADYHALQANLKRRFAETLVGQLQVEGSYTWAHGQDNVSEVFNTDSTASSFQSLPQVLGFSSRIDRGDSDQDIRQRFVANYVWDIRGPKSGVLGEVLGGWSLAGVSQFQTGSAFTPRNGSDRNGDGQSFPDRPDIGNINAPFNTRAQIVPVGTCSTGLFNPDSNGGTGTCVTAADVHFVQGSGLPTAITAGRNIGRTPGYQRWDLSVIKKFKVTERVGITYSAQMFNIFNHYIVGNQASNGNFSSSSAVPAYSVGTSPAGSFIDYTQVDSTPRTMRMQFKINF